MDPLTVNATLDPANAQREIPARLSSLFKAIGALEKAKASSTAHRRIELLRQDAASMLSVIGAGLGRTGTYSLHLALESLGLRSIHFDSVRLNDVLADTTPSPSFQRYDDVDAVVDVPTAYFYRELSTAYPDSKVILTVRDLETWWKSTRVHFNEVAPVPPHPRVLHRLAAKFGVSWTEDEHDIFRRNLRNRIYGSTVATEFICKKTFVEHNQLVVATVPPERLLVMDICAGDGWERLCPFLGLPAPNSPFPVSHTTNYANPTPWKTRPGT